MVAGGRSYIICRVFHELSNAENRIRFGPQIRKLWGSEVGSLQKMHWFYAFGRIFRGFDYPNFYQN